MACVSDAFSFVFSSSFSQYRRQHTHQMDNDSVRRVSCHASPAHRLNEINVLQHFHVNKVSLQPVGPLVKSTDDQLD